MIRPILFTSTAVFCTSILFNQTAMAEKVRSVGSARAPNPSMKMVEGGASALGTHEVNLRTTQSTPPSSEGYQEINLEKTPDVRLLPVPEKSGISSPVKEWDGGQVLVTPKNSI
jgi:hypothetical protein